jgi:hypothetical protein
MPYEDHHADAQAVVTAATTAATATGWTADGGPAAGGAASSGRMFEMSDKDRRRPPARTAGSERMRRRSSLDPGFDRYLARQLHQLYDPVLDEAVPDDLADLLERFERCPPDRPDEEPPAGG